MLWRLIVNSTVIWIMSQSNTMINDPYIKIIVFIQWLLTSIANFKVLINEQYKNTL